jgi:hypothetical protein
LQAGPAPIQLNAPAPNPAVIQANSGEPLAPDVRANLERSFGVDLQAVRVHTDERAQNTASSMDARAFTIGSQIYLGPGERPNDLRLLAHEVAHVVQQRGAPAVQRWSFSGGDRFEREAQQASTAAIQQQPFTVHERTSPRAQGFLGLDFDPRSYIAGKAALIPGFTLLTVIIGFNPITGAGVDRSAANILRGVIQLIPVAGAYITQALDNHGIVDKVANWVVQQFEALRDIGSSIVQAIEDFIKGLRLSDLASPGDVWERGKRIFTDPIDRIKNFAASLVDGFLTLIKELILKPIGRWAKDAAPDAYNLLCAFLGSDPITGEPATLDGEALLSAFLTFVGQGEVLAKMKEANAIPRTVAWFRTTMGELKAFVSQIPSLFITAFRSLTLLDIVTIVGAFAKVAGVFGSFAGRFISWGANAIWKLLEIVFDVVSPGALSYVKRTGSALKSILMNPLPFVGNLVKAAKLGFQNFAANIGTHLKAGLIDWLTGSLSGVYIPKALTLLEFGKFALSVLGITWAQIRGKIVKSLGPNGETIMRGLETAFDIVKALVTGGPAAAWEVIKDKLTNLKDMLVDGIKSFVIETIVLKAVPKLISMFIPGAGFISAILSIYDTVMVFVQKLAKIIQVVKGFIDSIVAIAAGQIGGAASRVEKTLAGLLSLAISFLAGFLGLGRITDKIMGVVNKVRAVVDKAIDTAIAWIIGKAKALFAKLFGKGKQDDRTPEQKQADLNKALQEAETLQKKPKVTEDDVRKGLRPIKAKYKMTALDLVVDNKTESKEKVHVVGSINPTGSSAPTDIDVEPDGPVASFKIPRPQGFEVTTAKALNPNDINLVEAKLDRRHIISSKDVAEHYETVLVNKKLWSEAKKVLNPKQAVEKPLGDATIQAAAKTLHNRFFNDLTNLFVGPRGQNRALGRRLDANKPGMTEDELHAHIESINARYALEGKINITL